MSTLKAIASRFARHYPQAGDEDGEGQPFTLGLMAVAFGSCLAIALASLAW